MSMSLAEIINEKMKAALKAKENATLSTLRLLRSAIKNKHIDVQHELSDQEIQDVVKTQVKQLKDAIESFARGGRQDLVQNAQAEIAVLEQFLPEQLSNEELLQIVKEAIEQTGATQKADVGRVMGVAMQAVAGRADGSRVREMVASSLAIFALAVCLSVFAEPVSAASFVETFQSEAGFAEFMIRIFRVLVLWLGIPAIMLVLKAGFEYMTACARDDAHTEALSKLTIGVFASLIVGALFAFSTVVLQEIS